ERLTFWNKKLFRIRRLNKWSINKKNWSMQEEVRIWLEDIEKAILEIDTFLPHRRNFLHFQKDLKTKRAVERNIEIIGEAMNRILKVAPEINISGSRKIVDTRNRIIHGYDSVSDDIIWLIVVRYLPILAKEIQAIKNKDTKI
ncbi:MAG: HepT-like ribonuclease domain-containing protein, partial [Bacteroidota bacterium]